MFLIGRLVKYSNLIGSQRCHFHFVFSLKIWLYYNFLFCFDPYFRDPPNIHARACKYNNVNQIENFQGSRMRSIRGSGLILGWAARKSSFTRGENELARTTVHRQRRRPIDMSWMPPCDPVSNISEFMALAQIILSQREKRRNEAVVSSHFFSFSCQRARVSISYEIYFLKFFKI